MKNIAFMLGVAATMLATAADFNIADFGAKTDGSKCTEAFYATVQMPSGVPVATVACGSAGPTNAERLEERLAGGLMLFVGLHLGCGIAFGVTNVVYSSHTKTKGDAGVVCMQVLCRIRSGRA